MINMVTRAKPRTQKQMWSDHRKQVKKLTQRGARPYAPNWSKKSVKIRRSTWHVCVCCLKAEAKLTHHWQYWRFGKVYGREIGGVDAGGVCEGCHRWLHAKPNWTYSDDPDKDCNTPEIISRLKFNYWMLYFGFNFWWVFIVGAIALATFLTGCTTSTLYSQFSPTPKPSPTQPSDLPGSGR